MKFGAGQFFEKEDEYPFRRSFFNSNVEDEDSLKLGLPLWRESFWKENLYRSKLKDSLFLKEYSGLLDCVEVSSTFYAPIGTETLMKWSESVSEGFEFLPKWPKLITHDYQLKNCESEMDVFIEKISVLGGKLGTTILQLPPSFSTEYKAILFHFLERLPASFPVSIEFRHSSWFQDFRIYPALEKYLIDKNLGSVCSDTPGRRDVFHLGFTGKKNIVRFLSDEIPENDKIRLNAWKSWFREQKKELFFILHNPDNRKSPELIRHIDDKKYFSIQNKRKPDQQSFIQ